MPTGQKLVLIEEAQPNERADWAIEVSALVSPPQWSSVGTLVDNACLIDGSLVGITCTFTKIPCFLALNTDFPQWFAIRADILVHILVYNGGFVPDELLEWMIPVSVLLLLPLSKELIAT